MWRATAAPDVFAAVHSTSAFYIPHSDKPSRQVDGARDFADAGRAVDHARDAFFSERPEILGQRCGAQLAGGRAPRDEFVHVAVHHQQLHDRAASLVALVIAFAAADRAIDVRRFFGRRAEYAPLLRCWNIAFLAMLAQHPHQTLRDHTDD